jgi:tRNA(Ile)-lysidine synthase
VTACQVEGLDVWEDPHNRDDSYTRVRVRRRVLPVLEDELGPGVTESLARTADLLRADMELLDAYAERARADVSVAGGLSVEAMSALEAPLRTRVLRAAALAAGAPPGETFHQHVVAVDALVTDWHGQKWVDLPGHLRAVRRDGVLSFEQTGDTA